MLSDFKEFLYKYNVVPLAIAFIMGAATITFVQSLVNDIIMPIIDAVLPKGEWQTATFAIGPVVIKWGSFLGAAINFVIIALVVFMLAKMVVKEQKVTKK
jgi:large conductance mechanosensitive channel